MPVKAVKLFVTAYLLLIFLVYPFYMKEGYVGIGNAKYEFFLYCSLGALAVFAILLLIMGIQSLIDRYGRRHNKTWEMNVLYEQVASINISSTDLFLCLYLAAVSVSALASPFRENVLQGTDGWHMGFLLWLVLCGLYLILSRWWDGRLWVWYLAVASSGVVHLLGILDSFSIYLIPLEVRESGFISTLGNINWFCGYLSVVGTLGIGCFFFSGQWAKSKNTRLAAMERAIWCVYIVITFMAGFCQGSSSVFLWFGALFFLLLWIGDGNKKQMERWLFLLFLWGISGALVKVMRYLLPGKYNYGLDNLCGLFTETGLTLWIAAFAFVCFGFLKFPGTRAAVSEDEANEQNDKMDTQKIKMRNILVLTLAAALFLWAFLSVVNTWGSFSGFINSSFFRWDESWGNGRGAALRAGFTAFLEMPLGKKLIGAGPDCFSAYVYSIDEVAVSLRDYFGSSRLTNAHCELLTSLVNVGVVGTACYIGIFVSFLVRAFQRGKEQRIFYIPAICLIGYLCHNLVSFAQVLNTPFAFLILAMGERMLRREEAE